MRQRTLTIVMTATLYAASAAAQELTPASQIAVTPLAITQTPATAPKEPQTTQPPAAVGEEGKKPTRGFVSSLFHNLADDVKHLPRQNSAYWLAGGGALALAVHPNDNKINRKLAGSPTADTLFTPGKLMGSTPIVLSAAASTYLIGRHSHKTRLQHLGMDEIEATLLAEGITQAVKAVVKRDRPLRPDGTRAAGGYSFPSGHATVTFAAATVLQQHLGYRAGIPTYLIASYVGMSRLHDNRHFASDVVFGAADGIIIGRSVTWHGRNFYASPMLLPGGGGIMIAAR